MNRVIVMYNGYSDENPDNPNEMLANCSCTLIQTPKEYFIVDTMTPWDGDQIVENLRLLNITTGDISAVISTHGHSDHCGNNNLFKNATKLIFGQCLSYKNIYQQFNFDKPFELSDGVEVIATPGHTQTCVSVIVRNTDLGVVAITGDLFEKEEDIENCQLWLSAGSEDPVKQRRNRSRVADLADYIVPGHGPMFNVTNEMKLKLKQELLD